MTTFPQGRLRVFLSHSSKDSSFCSRIVKNLRKIFGNDAVWYDMQGGLDSSESWRHRIMQEVARCNIFIPILSPEAMSSLWMHQELLLAKAQNKQIISVIPRPCEPWQELKNIPIVLFHSLQTYNDDFETLLQAIETIPLNSAAIAKNLVTLNSTNTDRSTNPLLASPPVNITAAIPITPEEASYPQESGNTVLSTPVAHTPPFTPQTGYPGLHLPHIFVSHSHIDDAFNTRLVRALRDIIGESEAVWNDTTDGLQGGDHWWSKIKQELSERPIFIVVLSPNAVTSKLVNDEINIAWNLKNSPEHTIRIIPILYRQCNIPVDLRTLHIISFLDPWAYDHSFTQLLSTLSQPMLR